MNKKTALIAASVALVAIAVFMATQSKHSLKYSTGDCLYNMAEHRVLQITKVDLPNQTYSAVQLPQRENLGERSMAASLLHSDTFSKINCPQY